MQQNNINRKNKMKNKQPKVELINYTQEALEILIFTKSGRLAQGVTLHEISQWTHEKKLEHLSYMKDTIKSSFEFVDYIFHIRNVSRAFTHQLVRTRTASFQQEAMRVVDARNSSCLVTLDDPLYAEAIEKAFGNYGKLVDKGYPVQDCRGILPTAVHTNIFIKANLRTLSQMAELRLCKRAEGEYQGVFKQMVNLVNRIHPWASDMLECYCVKTGLCYFPRYDKCPIQPFTLKPVKARMDTIKDIWMDTNHVANPKAKDGKTM